MAEPDGFVKINGEWVPLPPVPLDESSSEASIQTVFEVPPQEEGGEEVQGPQQAGEGGGGQ